MATPIQTMTDVREAVALLAAEFNISVPPVVRGSGQTSMAYLRYSERRATRLSISPNDWHGLEQATLHEFAHALRCAQVGRHGHDYGFYTALKTVIVAWTGDVTAYPWDREYWTLWTYAQREGLTTKRWFKYERREQVQAAANITWGADPAPSRPTAVVRVGATVRWTSTKWGGELTGVVVSAYPGCRARVRASDGRQFYVPQSCLRSCEASA